MVHHADPGLTPARPGRVRQAVAWLAAPPDTLRRGPFREDAFTSKLRSTRLTSQLGIALGVAFTICFGTGLISHFIQHPAAWTWWPAGPAQLYRITQGVHVATGLATVPLLGTKLWAVYPRLFAWPPLPLRPGAAAERVGVGVLVAAGLFQVLSGTLDVARWYAPMPFFFTAAHYWVAWLAVGAILAHVGVKLPIVRAALGRGPRPEPPVPVPVMPADQSARAEPQAARAEAPVGEAEGRDGSGLDRRRLLGVVGAAAGLITVATVGQTLAPVAPVSLLAPRRPTTGPQGVPVNKTALSAGVRDAALDPAYALRLVGPGGGRTLGLAELRALPQHTVVLPIACVEGWSSTGTWTGVRLRDLAALLDVDPARAEADVESMQQGGRYRLSTVATPHLLDGRTLIALRLNGEDLALDHGYPARLIAPNRPGVLQTKWVGRITWRTT
ncbi:molybdopterin-dependent oxidoreductase [Micromonosporaceae bacterium Da 78-11]